MSAQLRKLLWMGALGVGLILATLIVFKNPMLEKLIPYYLKSKGFQVQFEIQKLDLNQAELTKLQLFGALEISRLSMTYELSPFQLRSLDVRGENLNLSELLRRLSDSGFSPPKEPSSVPETDEPFSLPVSYSELSSACEMLQKMDLRIQLPELIWKEHSLPLDLSVSKTKARDPESGFNLSLSFNGASSRIQFQNRNSELKSVRYKGRFELLCNAPNLELAVEELELSVEQLKDQSLNLNLDSVDLLVPRASIKLDAQDRAQTDAKGWFSLKGLQYAAPEGPQLAFLHLTGDFEAQDTELHANLSLKDEFDLLDLKRVRLSYDWESSRIDASFEQKDSRLRFSPNLVLVFPQLKDTPLPSTGTLRVGGQIHKQGEQLSGHLRLHGKGLSINLESGQLQNVDFHHDVMSFSNFRSSPGQTLSVEKIDLGQPIRNLKMRYQVLSPEKLKIENLRFNFEEADILAHGFEFNPVTFDLSGFVGILQNLKLQHVLTLALKDAVSAEGLLSGHVKLKIKNKKPSVEGELKAHGPGRIRYRPEGARPTAGIQLTDDPMDILKAYLYDFSYKQLSLNIKTDENYNMILNLNTFGHNPGYMDGRPLKLNINLEQNLLAALRAIMLTYSLPEKLQKSFEKMGTK